MSDTKNNQNQIFGFIGSTSLEVEIHLFSLFARRRESTIRCFRSLACSLTRSLACSLTWTPAFAGATGLGAFYETVKDNGESFFSVQRIKSVANSKRLE
jgi:hypothetical protein